MPGAIQVSVLGFNVLGSSSTSSPMSIRVSMGKTEYQTWDKGDFSFPLTTLRDNLIITLLDTEGNEISHAGLETRLIVEKGLWDEVFPLEGGWHVHMKLQFVLTEEERTRIRLMRESALKKKLEELDSSSRSPESATSTGSGIRSSLLLKHEVSDSQPTQNKVVAGEAGLVSSPLNFFKNIKVDEEDKGKSLYILNRMTLNQTDKKEGTSSAIPMLPEAGAHLTEVYAVPPKLEDYDPSKLEKEGLLEKNPSNVRKMIGAFESCHTQDKKPLSKPPQARPQPSKTAMDSSLTSSRINDTKTEKVKPLLTVSGKEEVYRKEEMTIPEESLRHSTIEKATVSGRVLSDHQERHQPRNMFANKKHPCQNFAPNPKYSQEVPSHEVSNDTLKSVVYQDNDPCSFESSGPWIFPDEGKDLCVTTGGKKVVDLMGGSWNKTSTHQRKMNTSLPGNIKEGAAKSLNNSGKTSQKFIKPWLESSAEKEHPRGPLGQVMRVAIMVGFATLVLLTRQRKDR